VAAGTVTVTRESGQLAVLTFHAIDDRPSVTSLPPDLFRWQMQTLAAHGLTGISLAQAFDHLDRTGRFPPDTVALTFDDGYRSVMEHALPAMAAQGFSGTVFLVSSLVGLNAAQARAAHCDFDRDLLGWREAETLLQAGFEIGAHSVSHPDLTRLPADALERELGQARAQLEQRLQVPVTSLAYPYGRENATVRGEATRHYRRACTTRLGRCRPQADPLRIDRIDMYYLQPRQRFLRLLGGGLSGWLRWRQQLRELKRLAR
jgi:peptidoglycan/xylan/chitin deacetylase (PgdA/CDA1 family)